ncbi:MAG TPA: beta-propeller fold lactonase family protein [Spirochaetota bacterium]|nr:beta-propeller fold lactonase family protein [Spirochaetota bacterium]HPJ42297.1 beta-propeller fold lactonase family protein [Spirochaetota bacterium]
MKIRKLFIYCLTVLFFISCESGFEDMMDEAKTGIRSYRHYAYVANRGANTVSAYSMGTDGSLTWISDHATGTTPRFVKGTPNGKYLYVANSTNNTASNTISVYAINADGTLTGLGSQSLTGGTSTLIYGMAINPAGTYLYATNNVGSEEYKLYAFSIGSNGALTQLSGTPYAMTAPTALTVDPSGSFLLVTGFPSGTYGFASYPISGSTGVVTTVYAGYNELYANGNSITMDENSHVYVGMTSGALRACSMNASGALTEINTYSLGSESSINSLAASPDGQYLFSANTGVVGTTVGNISHYKINSATGELTGLSNYLGTGCSNPTSVAVDSTGCYLYVTNTVSNNITIFTINDNDTLSEIENVTAGTNPYSIALIKRGQ